MRSAARLARFSFNESVRGEKLDTGIEEIRRRVRSDYAPLPQPDLDSVMTDLKALVAEVDRLTRQDERHVEAGLKDTAALIAIHDCEKCDLCEDHH